MEKQIAREAKGKARGGHGWYAWLARGGLVAKGVSFGIVGALALKLALGDGGKATSREGALHTLAQQSFGKWMLSLLAAGFFAYAAWRVIEAATVDKDGEMKEWGKRVASLAKASIYAALTVSTLKLLLGSTEQKSQTGRARETTATVLSWPLGKWLVAAAGVAILGAGLWNGFRAFTRRFEKKWRTGEMGKTARKWGGRAGVAGHVARAVVFGLIGVFVLRAALEYRPRDAIGIDGALQKLAHASYGPWLLGLTAAGLVCYGIYCLVDARYRDVSANA